ncbi:MAG: VOC family protein [Chloroflexaceae bacterium]|nr:VOC family protein [Chloroflexaceae bacterium]
MAYFTFSHIAIACQHMPTIEQFYSRYFGFRRARVIPVGNEEIIFIKSGDIYLELFQAKEPAPVAPPEKDGPWYPGWRHIAFQVDDVDSKLSEMGSDARVTLGPLDFDDVIPGWRTVWVADPEGNIIEITQGYVDQANPPKP